MLSDRTKHSITVAMQEAQSAHGPEPDDDPTTYFHVFVKVAVLAGDVKLAKELMDNRAEAEQIVAGILGLM